MGGAGHSSSLIQPRNAGSGVLSVDCEWRREGVTSARYVGGPLGFWG